MENSVQSIKSNFLKYSLILVIGYFSIRQVLAYNDVFNGLEPKFVDFVGGNFITFAIAVSVFSSIPVIGLWFYKRWALRTFSFLMLVGVLTLVIKNQISARLVVDALLTAYLVHRREEFK